MPVVRRLRDAFTLIELLTVIAIIGVLAALLAPVLKNFSKPDVTVAATRQMLDDMARARQLAISQRSTVFVVFVHSNFWNDPIKASGTPQWASLPAAIQQSTVVTQIYGAQLNGYMMVSMRNVGDQPGASYPKDLVKVKTLPQGAFIPPFKIYDASPYPGIPIFPTNRPDLPIYRFERTNSIPFPTSDVLSNAGFANQIRQGTSRYVTVPYIAFNYLGQLTSGDGTVLPYDENIPLGYGSIIEPRDLTTHAWVQQAVAPPVEMPPGNSTNISYNIIHIDRLTGRARLERQDLL